MKSDLEPDKDDINMDGADSQLAGMEAELDAELGELAANHGSPAAAALPDGLTPVDNGTPMKLASGLMSGELSLSPPQKGKRAACVLPPPQVSPPDRGHLFITFPGQTWTPQ